MDPKDFKFNDDAFDDVFSNAPEDDSVTDIYSDTKADPTNDFESEFDDIFSGKREFEFYEMTGNNTREYTDDYYEDNDEGEFTQVTRRAPDTNPEKQPYSYNYGKASQNKAKKVSRERSFDSIEEDVYSGKQPSEKKPKKKFSFGRFLLVMLVILGLLVGGVSVAGYGFAKSLINKIDCKPLVQNKYIPASKLMHKDGVRNILLVGVDAREGEENGQTRSDTMMLLTIDDNNGQLKLTSFLRDTYIEIPEYAWAKLNAAQSHGGIQLLVDTLEYNFEIDIDNYVLVNFSMFTTIIDSIGGIDVEITDKEADYINSKDHMTPDEEKAFPKEISGGDNHFDGAQALWYARIRYLDSDFMRTQRQRKVISAIIDKAKKTNIVTLVQTANDVVSMVETDLDGDSIMSLGLNSVNYLRYGLAQQQIPADGTWHNATKNKQAVLQMDLEKNRSIAQEFIFGKAEIKADK